jgi:hypothetical protein
LLVALNHVLLNVLVGLLQNSGRNLSFTSKGGEGYIDYPEEPLKH